MKPIIVELQKQNIDSMMVFVIEDNRSLLFYEALGGKKMDTIKFEISGKKLNELVYGWDDIRSIFKE